MRRWGRFISAYLTSKNPSLPPLSEYFNEDDELEDYVDLINIAADEWMRGNLETRKEIVRKIGLTSDEKGRLVIQDVQKIPPEFRQQGMIMTLMNFHCSSWVHDIDEWESTSDPLSLIHI